MLVLRRNAGESFRVGDDVEVRILDVGRGRVKIGVIAPREIGVYRTELADMNRRAVVDDWRSAGLDELAGKLRPPDPAPNDTS